MSPRMPSAPGEAEQDAVGGEHRLLLPGQDSDGQVGQAAAQRLDEVGAVLGVAGRGGGQDLHRFGAHGSGDGGVAGENGEGGADRLLVQQAGVLQAAAEAEDGLLVERW
jgi:hypothetical protein